MHEDRSYKTLKGLTSMRKGLFLQNQKDGSLLSKIVQEDCSFSGG